MDEYEFEEQLGKGEAQERILDGYFGKWYIIRPATEEQQKKMGIDRIWRNRTTNAECSVEYKADFLTPTYGNVFIEIESVDITGAPGWALKSLAQILVYYIPPWGKAYTTHMSTVKKQLSGWLEEYPVKSSKNTDEDGNHLYNTYGIAVPVEEFVRHKISEHNIKSNDNGRQP